MKEMIVTINTKGVILWIAVIIALVFGCGFSTCKLMEKGREPDQFTKEELEILYELQRNEDTTRSGKRIYAYHDKDGMLWIGWESVEGITTGMKYNW